MMTSLRRRAEDEHGIAMITTIMVLVVLVGLGFVGLTVSLNNLQESSTDRLGGVAMGTSEAGIAQAVAYLRTTGVGTLACSPTCSSNAWGNQNSPQTVTVSGGRQYKVWIEVKQAFAPPVANVGTYVIHAVGTAGTGPGLRTLQETVTVKPFQFPIGIFAHTVNDAGSAGVHKESFFTDGCVTKRSHMTFSGTDAYWGIPAAVHSTQYITESNNGCSSTDNSNIHASGYCNPSYPNDQDAQGGSLTGTSCLGASGGYPQTSVFNNATLQSYGGLNSRGLTQQQYAALKATAQAEGQYYDCSGGGSCSFTAPDPAVYPNAVMYFKMGGGTLGIQNDLNAYGHTYCGSRSVIVVVENGDIHVNSGADITGAFFVPDGNYQGNGQNQIWGTLYAKTIDKFNGTADFYLDPCWLSNIPGGILDVTPTNFHEVDR